MAPSVAHPEGWIGVITPTTTVPGGTVPRMGGCRDGVR